MMTTSLESITEAELLSLRRFDRTEFERLYLKQCPKCKKGRLHQANYMRRARGLESLAPDGLIRYSLCCSKCRRRTTPPSAVFAARFVYCSLVILAHFMGTDARRGSNGPKASTRKRWKRWWSHQRSVRIWKMHCTAATARADLPFKELLRFLSRPLAGSSGLVRLLTFRPDVLWV